LLASIGYEVRAASGGMQAVEAVRQEDFDAVLMDVQMPELDGVQATQQIRALPPPKCDVPIIALTAHAMSGAREAYLDAGMDDYLSKPLQPEALLSKLTDLARALKPRKPTANAATAAPPADNGGAEDVDGARLASLEAVLGPDGVREIVGAYLANTAERMARVVDAAAASGLADLRREAHTIAGTSGNIGAVRVSTVAKALEAACECGDHDGAARLAKELEAATAAAASALKVWLATPAAPELSLTE
jgi:CheY-like chemotaxis protein/HPt (histidine-containing phosphotransfer) domain-containing protein